MIKYTVVIDVTVYFIIGDKMDSSDLVMSRFRERVIITIDELTSLDNWSTITARRRLRRWGAYTSYNRNGRYYVLPDIPRFDAHGLWEYNGVRFSRSGTLTSTLVRLVDDSDCGLTASELSELLGYEMHPVLSRLTKQGTLRRFVRSGRNVYLSKQPGRFETQNGAWKRSSRRLMNGLPLETQVFLLIEKIKSPSADPSKLAAILRGNGYEINSVAVESFLENHGLLKKT